MEPQPYRCGGTACNPGTGFTVMLQWSRTFIVAESFLYGILVENASALQWGRNFIVAEIQGHTGYREQVEYASMGPQLYRCGNVPGELPHLGRTAVLQWGRNFIVAEMPADQHGGRVEHQLQRGRNFIVAEISYRTRVCVMELRLQWGRNFIVAEISYRTRVCVMELRLQWGRNFIVAEISYRTASFAGPRSFNGAATLSLRKYSYLPAPSLPLTGASMGPQLYRCGNATAEEGITDVLELQWGRNFIVAEIWPSTWLIKR